MKQKLSKNQQILGWVFLWNTLICLYSILFLNPVSSSNDDFWLSAIAGNGFGSHSEFLIYVSTLLGYILKFFYHFIPSINWYALFLYVFLLISVVTIEYIATIKFNLSVILLSLFFFHRIFPLFLCGFSVYEGSVPFNFNRISYYFLLD